MGCAKHPNSTTYIQTNGRAKCRQCNIDAVDKRRKKLKQQAIKYLGGGCCRCGYSKCTDALEFHHKNQTHKEFGISASGTTRSWAKIKTELDKCILICSNCHRELHYNERKTKNKQEAY